MIGKITEESMKFLTEEIVYAVESTSDKKELFEVIKEILESNGIVEVIPD